VPQTVVSHPMCVPVRPEDIPQIMHQQHPRLDFVLIVFPLTWTCISTPITPPRPGTDVTGKTAGASTYIGKQSNFKTWQT